MSCFTLLVCPVYALPIKLLLPETTNSHLHPSDSLPKPADGEVKKQLYGADSWLGLNFPVFFKK